MTRAAHVIGGLLTAAFLLLVLMTLNIVDTPQERWREHQTTKRMIQDMEWGIRTYPQETDQ